MSESRRSLRRAIARRITHGLLALNVLSLDAPLIAVAWQDLAARLLDSPLLFSQRLVLALTTWLVYAGDRLLDARPNQKLQSRLPRHRFAGRHRKALFAAWLTVLAVNLLFVSAAMPMQAWPVAIVLGAAVVCYFMACEKFPRTARGLIPREAVVSLFFVVAVFFFPLAIQPHWTSVGLTEAFTISSVLYALAFLNCFAIACWERREDRRMGEVTLATGMPHPRFILLRMTEVLCLVLLGVFWLPFSSESLPLFAIAATVSLRGLDRSRLSTVVRPVLADICLLFPWLGGIFL